MRLTSKVRERKKLTNVMKIKNLTNRNPRKGLKRKRKSPQSITKVKVLTEDRETQDPPPLVPSLDPPLLVLSNSPVSATRKKGASTVKAKII